MELLFVARTHDHGSHGRPLQEPVERDLRNGLAGFLRYVVDGVDDLVDIFVGHLRAVIRCFVEAAYLGQRLPTADLAG